MSWEAALDPWTCWLVTLTLAHVGWIGLVVAGLAAVGDRLDRSPSAGRRCRLHFGALLILGLTLPATFEVVRRTTPRPVEDASSSVTMPEPSRPEARSTTAPFRPAAGDEPLVAPGGTAPRPARSNAIRDVTVLVRSTSEAAAARRTGAGAMLRASAPFIAVMYALGVVVLLRRPGGGRRRRSDGLRRLALAVAELQLGGERATPAVSALDGRRRSELRRRIGRLLELADEPAIRLTRAGGLALIVLVGLTVGLSAALLSAQDGPGPRGQRNAAKDADTPKAVPAQRQSPSEPVVAIKAVPLATFTVHTIDSHGQPAKAWDRGYVLYGQLNGEPWNTQFHGKPGRPDVLMARVPIGLREVGVYCQSDNVWWTWSPGTPRVSHDAVGLTVVDGDRPEIHVQRMKSALLEIRLQVKSGNLTQEPSVFVSGPQSGQPSDAPGQAQYPAPPPVFGAPGSQSPGIVAWRPLGRPRLRASAPGIFRLDEELLPGRETVVHVDAPGHRNLITRPFQFTEEGQQGVVEITLEPRLRSQNSLKRLLERGAEPVLVPVTLKGPDGNPIPQPAIPRKPVSREGPYRSIGCRAIDQSTGRPVAGAAVTFAVQQKPDDARVPVFRTRFSGETETDQDGRFTVSVPEDAIQHGSSQHELAVVVAIDDPRYVTDFHAVDPREIARRGITEDFPRFRKVELIPARQLTGRLLSPEGQPVAGVHVSRTYDDPSSPRDAQDLENPVTDQDGRFRARAPLHAALKLEFRANASARRYYEVAADQTDLGDIRLSRGVRVSGRVVDGAGGPVKWVDVTVLAFPATAAQPIVNDITDEQGRFQTDELPPGRYRVQVEGIRRMEGGIFSLLTVRHSPGAYIPVPVAIRENQAIPELTIRPVEPVRFVARLVVSRPEHQQGDGETGERILEKANAAIGMALTAEEAKAAVESLSSRLPIINVRGNYRGVPWESQTSFLASSELDHAYVLLVPKGLTDATLEFGMVVQKFRLDANAPDRFGPAIRLGRVDADRSNIQIRRYRETTLGAKVEGEGDARPTGVKVQARYLREPEMRAAGVVFEPPPLQPMGSGGAVRFSVLPDEEIELTVEQPDGPGTTARVKLAEGEIRELNLRLARGR